jgi:hypothetical protein
VFCPPENLWRTAWRLGRRLALAALLIGTAAACSSGAHHRPPPVTASTTTTPATSTTTEPAQQFAPSPYSWVRSTAPALALGGGPSATLSAVLAPPAGGQWEVFGSRLDGSGSPTAAAWTSADARTWSVAALTSVSGPSQVRSAARYKSATVTVGSTGVGGSEQAAVWMSPAAGAPFVAETVPPTDAPSSMSIVAAGALGMFSAGSVDGRFALWSSTDGRQWQEVPAAEKVVESSPGARVNAMLASGVNIYAAGSVQLGSLRQPALWTTSDGINWHLVSSASPSFAGPTNRAIYSLAPLGSGLVAVGGVEKGTRWAPASWISPDGQSWSLASLDFEAVPAAHALQTPGDGTSARSVSAVTTLLGSTEVVAAGGGPDGQAVWQSSDGLHWSSMALAPKYAGATSWRAELAAATVDTVVVVDAESGQPYLLSDGGLAAGASHPPSGWSEPSANPAVFGSIQPQAVPVALESSGGHVQLTVQMMARPQSIGAASSTTEVLSSTDGRSWAVGATIPGPTALPSPDALVTKVPTGWVAVASRPAGGPVTWTSRNGASWTPAGSLTIPAPPTTTTTTLRTSTHPAAQWNIQIRGLCSTRVPVAAGSSSPSYVVAAVGSAISPAGAASSPSQGAAWIYSPGRGWQNAPVSPPLGAGSTESMSGCVGTASGLTAYGVAPAPGGAPAPATWQSADGTAWNRVSVSAFGPLSPNPLVSMATDGANWLAAARPIDDASPSPSLETGQEGLWLSTNAGASWQAVDTFIEPWRKADRSELYLVAFATGTPVIAGVVDGRLAVWTGV